MFFVDQQRLAGANDLRSESGAKGPRLRVFAIGVREVQHHGRAVEQRDVSDRRVEQVANLLADELDQRFLIKLRGERLRNVVDGDQFRRALADFLLPLVDQQVGIRVVERDGGV